MAKQKEGAPVVPPPGVITLQVQKVDTEGDAAPEQVSLVGAAADLGMLAVGPVYGLRVPVAPPATFGLLLLTDAPPPPPPPSFPPPPAGWPAGDSTLPPFPPVDITAQAVPVDFALLGKDGGEIPPHLLGQ